ncbi:g12345 [Coccomyxa viridis]|uniref:G12345 protein n=1 Tax=Coccomyxa viridis TaxID=1274662 RepID=A0ABP1GB71_9CHLO
MSLPTAFLGSRGLCISRHQQFSRLHTSLCGQPHSLPSTRKHHSLCEEHMQQRRHFRLCTPVCMGRRSAKIATRKGAQDAKRAKVWGTIAKKIIQAAKACGGDPANARLIEVLKLAKAAEVPKDLIDRNIKKATDKAQADYQEIVYEAYGAGGTGFIMECLTDNVNRSATDVRTAIVKGGGKMADSGSVLFNFQRRGEIYVKGNASTEEEVMDAAMDAGADDVQPATGDDDEVTGFKVLTAPEDFGVVREKLQELGQQIDHDLSGLVYTPLAHVEVEDSAFEMNESILERLLTVDDVDAIHTNCAGLSV